MLREVTIKEALQLIEEDVPVYSVNLNQQRPILFKLADLLAETRIIADLPEEPVSEKKKKKFAADAALKANRTS